VNPFPRLIHKLIAAGERINHTARAIVKKDLWAPVMNWVDPEAGLRENNI
jgi:hypothetical protein